MASQPWRWPKQSPQNHPTLHSYASTSDLHEDPVWPLPPSRRSPSAVSSTSSTSSTDRSVTPTNSSPPVATSTNPWFPASPAAARSPRDSPNSRTPQFTSRSTTPVAAPRPLRPNQILASVALDGGSPTSPNGETPPRAVDVPPPPTPNPFRGNVIPAVMQLSYLFRVLITTEVLTACTQHYPQILARLRWQPTTAQFAYSWACLNPKLALLFWMCEDVDAWKRAYIYQLEDRQMPYQVPDLEGIAANPKKACDLQWRVMVKKLPQSGAHIEFKTFDCVPLEQVGEVISTSAAKRLDRVKWFGDGSERSYVRKMYVCSRDAQKSAAISQLLELRKLNHPNIARAVCSYNKDGVVAVVSAPCQFSLEHFLHSSTPVDQGRSANLVNWINDLSQALYYIHSKKMHHGSIRPHKILIDGSRVLLSAFGIMPESDRLLTAPDQVSTSDPAYIYAAPETVSEARRLDRSSDVFSLGCVFLCMVTAIKGWSLLDFAAYRATTTYNNSFHANLARVETWRKQLRTIGGGTGPRSRERSAGKSETQALDFIGVMIRADPDNRAAMRRLAPYVKSWHEPKVAPPRRSSFDAGRGAADRLELRALDSYYSSRPVAVPERPAAWARDASVSSSRQEAVAGADAR